MIRLVILVRKIGPYHDARYRTLAANFAVTVVQYRPDCDDYDWKDEADGGAYAIAPRLATGPKASAAELSAQMQAAGPEVVALTGYSDPEVQLGLAWCLRCRIPAIVMSDSQRIDAPRWAWRERLKGIILKGASAGFAAGTASADYLASLGVPRATIGGPYNVVDNAYFGRAVELRQSADKPPPAFLCVARFIEKKNLFLLLSAYRDYRGRAASPWPLILAGDGPLREQLTDRIQELGLQAFVSLPGFVQYGDLPKLYASARALILPSLVEQWGLAVNEAMAAGLAVLVSENCGCAPELVKSGVNGFLFDPRDSAGLAGILGRMTEADCAAMGRASQRLIAGYDLANFARGFDRTVELARKNVRPAGGWRRRAILWLGERGMSRFGSVP